MTKLTQQRFYLEAQPLKVKPLYCGPFARDVLVFQFYSETIEFLMFRLAHRQGILRMLTKTKYRINIRGVFDLRETNTVLVFLASLPCARPMPISLGDALGLLPFAASVLS